MNGTQAREAVGRRRFTALLTGSCAAVAAGSTGWADELAPSASASIRPQIVTAPSGSNNSTNVRSVKQWGGHTNATTLQRAIDDCSMENIELWIPGDEIVDLDAPLLARENMKLTLSSAVVLRRRWRAANASFGSGMLTLANWDQKVNGVRLRGGVWSGLNAIGRVIEFLGDNWTIEDVTISHWGDDELGAMGILAIGDRLELRRIGFANPGASLGTDGIHIGGGRSIVIDGVTGTATDDLVGLFPIVRADRHKPALRLDHPIDQVTVRNVFGASTQARLVGLGLHSARLSTTVRNIDIAQVSGRAGGRAGITVRNAPKIDGAVQGICLRNVDLVCAAACDTGAIRIEHATDVLIEGARVAGFSGPGLNLLQVDNFCIKGFDIDSRMGGTGIAATSGPSKKLSIRHGTILSANDAAIRLGAGAAGGVTDVTVQSVEVISSGTAPALSLENSSDVTVTESVFRSITDAPGSMAVRISEPSTRVEILSNNSFAGFREPVRRFPRPAASGP